MSDTTVQNSTQAEPEPSAPQRGRHPIEGIAAAYTASTEEELPLGSYATLLGIYSAIFMAALQAVASRDCSPLEQITAKDFLLLSLATHKLSRLVTKDWVTTPVRAPFARYQESTGAGEVSEKPRGTGMQKALGELFT